MPFFGRRYGLLLALALAVFVFAGRVVAFYVDYLWYESVGYSQVFFTGLLAGLALFAAGAALFLAVFWPSTLWALGQSRRLVRRAPVRLEPSPERPPRPRGPFGGPFAGMGMGTIGGIGGVRPFGDETPRPFGDLAAALGGADAARWALRRAGGWLVLGIGLPLAAVMGLGTAATWETALRWRHAAPFGLADPIFGYDVAFHVFTLPLLDALQSWLFWALLLSLLAAAALYLLALYAVDPSFERAAALFHGPARAMRSHLLLLGALLLLVLAWGFWVGMFDLLLVQHTRLAGANYADVHARLPATQALIAATVLTALLSLASALRRDYRLPLAGGVLMAVAFLVGRGVLPVVVQKLQVEPAELAREQPFIAHSIAFTRRAYGLDRVQEQTFPAEDTVRAEDLRADPETVANIRLWDPRPLQDTYNQVQSIRPYYRFDDVDVDRYRIDGRVRQVMLSARELDTSRLGQGALTWFNRRLQYTHGYGVAMSAVNEISQEGLPSLLLRDLPPVGSVPVTRPEVYYGEQSSNYVIVNAGVEEFDYPRGDQSAFTTYGGEGGVRVGPIWRRAALAWYLADFNLLVSSFVRPDSRVLFRRLVAERVQRVVPFAKLDRDPYLVIAGGELHWIVDGYTLADRFPYAQRVVDRIAAAGSTAAEGGGAAQPFGATGQAGQAGQSGQSTLLPGRRYTYNYIRNSLKVAVNAYDGSVRVYLADPDDPVARVYADIFPGLFRPLSEMPAELRAHVRYPEDLFTVQAQVLRSYHVQDPQVFYNGEDVWSLAFEGGSGDRQVVEPYYLIMRLPGETQAEFVLVNPFTPLRRDNMTAWLAARSDAPNYGSLILYKFPRDRVIYGPAQIATRINQDPTISAQLTVWNQQGSRVQFGNLLVIPIGGSTLYVQPLYLVAERSQLPELKRVIIATGNRLVMEPTLDEALLRLFGAGAVPPGTGAAPPGAQGPGQPGAPATAPPTGQLPGLTGAAPEAVRAAAQEARDTYQRAQEALRAGDFARFGEELRRLEEQLDRLQRAAGSSP
jgi:uncharacterized protein